MSKVICVELINRQGYFSQALCHLDCGHTHFHKDWGIVPPSVHKEVECKECKEEKKKVE